MTLSRYDLGERRAASAVLEMCVPILKVEEKSEQVTCVSHKLIIQS